MVYECARPPKKPRIVTFSSPLDNLLSKKGKTMNPLNEKYLTTLAEKTFKLQLKRNEERKLKYDVKDLAEILHDLIFIVKDMNK